jgi:CBS domain-containing protein
MTRDVAVVGVEQSIQQAARLMQDMDVGSLPVGSEDHLVGMVTDRDIVLRAVAGGQGCDTPVAEVMSRSLKYCYEDDTVEDGARNMAELEVRRLPVVNRDKRLVGMVSLANVVHGDNESGERLAKAVAQPH